MESLIWLCPSCVAPRPGEEHISGANRRMGILNWAGSGLLIIGVGGLNAALALSHRGEAGSTPGLVVATAGTVLSVTGHVLLWRVRRYRRTNRPGLIAVIETATAFGVARHEISCDCHWHKSFDSRAEAEQARLAHITGHAGGPALAQLSRAMAEAATSGELVPPSSQAPRHRIRDVASTAVMWMVFLGVGVVSMAAVFGGGFWFAAPGMLVLMVPWISNAARSATVTADGISARTLFGFRRRLRWDQVENVYIRTELGSGGVMTAVTIGGRTPSPQRIVLSRRLEDFDAVVRSVRSHTQHASAAKPPGFWTRNLST